MADYMKKPCEHCPFRVDVTPFLHPDRASDLAYSAENPYSSFPCHKTLEDNEDYDDECEDSLIITEASKECAGFLTLRARETSQGIPDGFEPDWDGVYENEWHMSEAYQDEWDKARGDK